MPSPHAPSRHQDLHLFGGTLAGDDRSEPALEWGGTFATIHYGSSVDTWDLELTPAIVNADDFAVALAITYPQIAGNDSPEVDHVAATVFFCRR